MSEPGSTEVLTPPPDQRTSFVDRINLLLHVRRYLKLVGRRWWILLICVAVGTGHASWRAFTTPNTYRAWSVLGFKPKVLTETGSRATVVEVSDKFYDTMLQLMKSSKVLARVDKALLQEKGPSIARPAYNSPNATLGQGSTFQMSVESTDLDFAKRYVTAWAREFINFRKEQRINTVGEAAFSTHDDKIKCEKKYEAARENTLRFAKEKNIISLKETLDAVQQRLDRQLDEYHNIQMLRERLEKQKPEDLAKQVATEKPKTKPEKAAPANQESPTQNLADPLAIYASGSKYSEIQYQVFVVEAETKRRSETLKPKHPFMVNLQRTNDQLKADLSFELKQIEEKQQATIKSLRIQEESYRPIIEDLKKKVQDSINIQFEYNKLKEEENNLKAQLDRLTQALISIDSLPNDEGQFESIEEGKGNAAPVAPIRSKMILTGLLIGLAVGIGLAYFLHRLDDRLELAEDIEAELQEPMLGQVPLVNTRGLKRGYLLITELDQYSFFSESIRGVRSAVMLGSPGASNQVLLVSSAVPGDGKTTFTVNFAATLALAGHRVLLVDADLRRGNIHNYFKLERAPGFSEVLAGELHWTDVVKQTEIKALDAISTGRLPANPGELLISPITRQFVEEVKREYNYVVFDCPPLTAIDDTFSLVGMADGLLFVIRAGQTSMRFAKNALAAVRQRGTRILGLVLNGITADNPYYYYNNYYHSYYSKTKSEAAALSTALPGVKMASPKMRAYQAGSIAMEAKAHAGQKPSLSAMVKEEQSKSELFKARRAAQKSGTGPDTSLLKKDDAAPVPSQQEQSKQN